MEPPSPMKPRELNAPEEPYPHPTKELEESLNIPLSPPFQGQLSSESALACCNGNWLWGSPLSALPRDSKRMLEMLYVPVRGSKTMLNTTTMSFQRSWSYILDWISKGWTVVGWLSILLLALLAANFVFGLHEVVDVSEAHKVVPLESFESNVSRGSLPQSMRLPTVYSFVESERERIYAYYEPPPLGHADSVLIELSMVRHWKRSFLRHGWMPILLSMADAAQVEGFQDMKQKLSSLPTVNSRHYELSCFLRWIAMAGVGGGYMSDYDVVNYGVAPPGRPLSDSIVGYEPLWPMFTSGKAGAYLTMAKTFASTSPENIGTTSGQPHTSDMILSRTVYKDMFTISDLTVRPLFHYSHNLLAEIFGTQSPFPRLEQVRKSNCYMILSKMSPLQIIILPITEATTKIAVNLQNALNECMQVSGVDGRKPDLVFEGRQPYTIVLTAPTIVATLLEEHEAYIRQSSLEQQLFEYTDYILRSKDTNEAPIQTITGHKSHLVEKIRASPRILNEGQDYNSTELLNALAQDGVFIGFLDKPRESLELLEYEMGFFFDSVTRERLEDSWTRSWTHMSLLLSEVPKEVGVWMQKHFSQDECALQTMQSQFEARLEHLRRIQELEREPFITNVHTHFNITNS